MENEYTEVARHMAVCRATSRLPLTAGVLSLPMGDTARGFSIFVSEGSLYLEIVDEATYRYSAPMFLLEDAERQGNHKLPSEAVKAVERLADSGASVLAAMVASIKAEMRAMARDSKLESKWYDHPEALIWQLVKAHVPADIEFAVYALLKAYRPDFDDTGRVVVKRRDDL